MKKYKIINKRRFTVFIVFSFSLVWLISFIFINSIKAEGSILQRKYLEHYIIDGDTLWNIALEYMPKKYDIRKMVYEIRELNKLETSYIFPGEIIKIPLMENRSDNWPVFKYINYQCM